VDETQLIERVQNGDAVAERELFERHVDRVYRLAFRMTGQRDLAQDFTQDTFIRAFDRIGAFRRESAFSTWLHSVATTTILNGLRKVKRFRSREADLEEAATVGRTDRVADPDLKDHLNAAIDDLPDNYRIVFVMHDVEGYRHEEIATALGMKVGTSKAQLSRARTKLRESLAAFAGEWAS
jgi:RNA polymerase sigma-70 factor (ECF subfamily)